jgi:small subunit ribosomal protein S17
MADTENTENEAPEEAVEAAEATEAAEAGTESTPAASGGEDAGAAEAAQPAEVLHPKERRRRERQRRSSEGTARSPEERQAERQAARAAKAKARSRRRRQERERTRAARTDAPAADDAPREVEPGRPKVRQGVAVSNKADKTITVRIDAARRHRRYQKIVRSSSTLHAHDERNDANEGDTVRVVESRPLSRTKRWRLVEVLERAK